MSRFIANANYTLVKRAQRWERLFNKNHIVYTKTIGNQLLVPHYEPQPATRAPSEETAFALNEPGQFSLKATPTVQNIVRVALSPANLEDTLKSEFLVDTLLQNIMEQMDNVLQANLWIGTADRTIGQTRGTFFRVNDPSAPTVLLETDKGEYEIRFYSNCAKYKGPHYVLPTDND